MTRRRLALLVLAVTAAQLIVGLALLRVQPEPTCPAFRFYSYLHGRCVGNVEFDVSYFRFLWIDAGSGILLNLLDVLTQLLAVVVVMALLAAVAPAGRMRHYLLELVLALGLILLALFLSVVASSLLDPLGIAALTGRGR
jgi:hypothetical protein